MTIKEFLEKIEEIYQEQPAYERGHDGSDGKCDCIGLIKGAIRRCGKTPSGLKGTNYAARYTIKDFEEIKSAKALSIGEVVLKAKSQGDEGYDLPDEYKPGGKSYNGDLLDYSHIGVVTGVNPLEITHMTSPKPAKDTKIGKWRFHGWLPQIDGISPKPDPEPEPARETATVWAASGETVNMRKGPSTSKALVERVPIGSKVTVMEYEPDWSQIEYTDSSGITRRGWMMTEFLVFEVIPAEDLEADGQSEDSLPGEYVTITFTAEEVASLLLIQSKITDQAEKQIGRG